MLRFFGWGSSKSNKSGANLDDELNQNLPYPVSNTHSSRSYKTTPSQISISAPIPRAAGTSLTGFDNPSYGTPGASSSSNNDPYHYRHATSSYTRLGPYAVNPASTSSSSVGRLPVSSPKPHHYPQYHLPSPPLSEYGGHGTPVSSIYDGPLPAVIRIETDGLPSRNSKPDSHGVPASSSRNSYSHSETAAPRAPTASTPMPVRKTLSSPPTPTSPHQHSISPADSTSSSSELTPPVAPGNASSSGGGRWNLKLHTTNPIYSQSTQSLPAASSMSNSAAGFQFRSPGMHSDPSLAYPDGRVDSTHPYSYPLVKPLSPIAEQDYLSPDSLQGRKSLPGSTPVSRTGSEKDVRVSYGSSPIGSQTSEVTRPSPSYASPFISRPLNRTGSQGSSRTHVSATSSAGARQQVENPPMIPPLDLRPSFIGPHQGTSSPSPTGSGSRIRSARYSNPMPMIIGSMEGGEEEDDYACTTESLHAESFVTATSDDHQGRPRRGNSVKDIETVDKESFRRNNASRPGFVEGGAYAGAGGAASVRSAGSTRGVVMPPSASESFITRRWDRDVGLGPGVPTFRAKKQWINVTPAFWAFWVGFLCPFLWLVGGWHFTNYGEQPPRLTFWEFYFNTGYCTSLICGKRNRKREMELRKEGKMKSVEPPPLPRWVSEKQSSELGRARLNDPKRSLKGISFGYPFIPRPVPVYREETFMRSMATRLLVVLDKPNRIFDQLYGIKLREVRGRPEGPRRMFDPWIQRCRYALCYAMLLLAIGLCTASAYLIVYNTRQL